MERSMLRSVWGCFSMFLSDDEAAACRKARAALVCCLRSGLIVRQVVGAFLDSLTMRLSRSGTPDCRNKGRITAFCQSIKEVISGLTVI